MTTSRTRRRLGWVALILPCHGFLVPRVRSSLTRFYIAESSNNETYDFWKDSVTVQSFNMDLTNLALDDPYRAQDALEIMRDLHAAGQPATIEPDVACYQTVLNGFVLAQRPAAAQQVLIEMESLGDVPENAYMLVAQGWADQSKDDVTGACAQAAEDIVWRLRERGVEPSVKIWSIAVEGACVMNC